MKAQMVAAGAGPHPQCAAARLVPAEPNGIVHAKQKVVAAGPQIVAGRLLVACVHHRALVAMLAAPTVVHQDLAEQPVWPGALLHACGALQQGPAAPHRIAVEVQPWHALR